MNKIQMRICVFDDGWSGKCSRFAFPNSEFCEQHHFARCESCGKQATRSCPEVLTFVCGTHICGNCEHKFDDKGRSCGHGPKSLKVEKPFIPKPLRKHYGDD